MKLHISRNLWLFKFISAMMTTSQKMQKKNAMIQTKLKNFLKKFLLKHGLTIIKLISSFTIKHPFTGITAWLEEINLNLSKLFLITYNLPTKKFRQKIVIFPLGKRVTIFHFIKLIMKSSTTPGKWIVICFWLIFIHCQAKDNII